MWHTVKRVLARVAAHIAGKKVAATIVAAVLAGVLAAVPGTRDKLCGSSWNSPAQTPPR